MIPHEYRDGWERVFGRRMVDLAALPIGVAAAEPREFGPPQDAPFPNYPYVRDRLDAICRAEGWQTKDIGYMLEALKGQGWVEQSERAALHALLAATLNAAPWVNIDWDLLHEIAQRLCACGEA